MESISPGINFEEHLRRSNGRSSRHSVVSVRLTRSEQVELERMAKADRKALSEWCRDALLAAARGEVVTPVFTEVVAIRQLLNSALESIACGEAVTREKFQTQLQTIRSTKHKAAAEVMQQYAALESTR
jgi:hypothetical protein